MRGMRYLKQGAAGAALLGLALFLTGLVLPMRSPGQFYQKLALFAGGGPLSLTALTLEAGALRRRGD